MLARGRYPAAVKRRIASRYGHLDNEAAAGLLAEAVHPGLQWVVALHLSEQNNARAEVERLFSPALADYGRAVHVASQHVVGGWLEVA